MKNLHPQVVAVLGQLSAKIDQNGDGKLDAADLDIVRQRAEKEADRFVEKQSSLVATGIALAVGIAIGVICTLAVA